jgi:hypothetical protein
MLDIFVGKSSLHHYLFDPTADAVFQPPLVRSHVAASSQLTQSGAQAAILNLMRRQLDFTENQLR